MNKSDSLKLIYWGTAGCASRAVSNFLTGIYVKDLMFHHNERGWVNIYEGEGSHTHQQGIPVGADDSYKIIPKLIIQSGITRVVYKNNYRNLDYFIFVIVLQYLLLKSVLEIYKSGKIEETMDKFEKVLTNKISNNEVKENIKNMFNNNKQSNQSKKHLNLEKNLV